METGSTISPPLTAEQVTAALSPLSAIVGVSSWALHHVLGAPPIYGAEAGCSVPDASRERAAAASLSLLDLPAELARRGFDALQICHFHLPTREPAYLRDLRDAIAAAGLPLGALLVDAGDMTDPDNDGRDEEWIGEWLPVAALLGAGSVRVIAGKSAGEGAMDRSVAAMRRLARRASDENMGLMTENWFPLLSSPAALLELLERCEGQVRFQLDFSNWGGPAKYANLAEIAPYAVSCHAQADFLETDRIRVDDYRICLDLPYPDGFRGPFYLVNSGSDSQPWEGLRFLRDFIRAHYAEKVIAYSG